MPWQMIGRYVAPCSCDVGCPCLLGELDGDRGWCSGIIGLDIQSGQIDGVDIGGSKVVLVADWPRGFLAGEGKGRVYFDNALSDEQCAALEPVLGGQKGGVFEAIGGLVPEILPSERAAITFSEVDEELRVTVEGLGVGIFNPLKGPSGERTRVLHAAASFRDDTFLGKGTGTHFHAPGFREWESGGHSEMAEFAWSA